VMDEALPPWPAVDLLAQFRPLNIAVVALKLMPPPTLDNWIELQFAPDHHYTVQDAHNSNIEQTGRLDANGFARVALPPNVTEVNFWFQTDVETRPWYFDAPLQVVGGVRDAGQEVLDVTFELGTWLDSILPLGVILTGESAPNGYLGYVFPWEDNYAEVQRQLAAQGNPLNLPTVAKPDTTVGAITNDVSQFLIGFIPAMRAVKFIKPASKTGALVKGMAVGAVVDATVFDPHEARLSDLLQQYPALRNPITAYLASDPTDSTAEGRFKLAVEGLILGAVAEQFLSALKVIKYARIRHLVEKARVRFRYVFRLEGAGSKLLPKNLSVSSLDDIANSAINPNVVRSELGKYVRGGNANSVSVAVGSVEINGKIQHILSVSGKAWKGNAPKVVNIQGVEYKVIRSDSGALPSVTNGPNGSTNFNHAEQKLMSHIQEAYKGANAKISIGVQNTSLSKPGMCSGCSITSTSFAYNNPLFNIKFFEGTTGVNP